MLLLDALTFGLLRLLHAFPMLARFLPAHLMQLDETLRLCTLAFLPLIQGKEFLLPGAFTFKVA
jgi:hypothetical protein